MVIGLATVVLVATVLVAVRTATAAQPPASSGHPATSISLTSKLYKPVSQAGSTDDYHCTLLNPHVTRNSYVISSQFFPGSPRTTTPCCSWSRRRSPPRPKRTMSAARVGPASASRRCPTSPIDDISSTPLLSVWAPGHGADDLPRGTGIELPAGSLVIMQVHYNLLVGDKPVKNSLVLHTVPTSTPLQPLKLDLMPAPPDIPCPAGVTGPLCNRAASLADQGQRFGQTRRLPS